MQVDKQGLVNESLKKIKFHLARFDNLVKIRTTPDARTEGEWGFEHTKAVFNKEIILFLKSLKDIFNVFDKDLLNEIIEVQTIFDLMDATVQQSSVDKQCLEIAKKELLLENDRLLQQIMSQEVLLTMMNSMSLRGESVNMDGKRKEYCNLEAELLKSQNQYFENDDLKAQLDKDSTICKLKDIIKSMREKSKEENVFKKQFDSIKKTRVRTKEQRKEIVDIAAQIPSANTIVLGMFKLDLEPLAPSAKKVGVTPKNKVKKVRFAEPLTSSSNIKQIESLNTSDSNTPMLSSTRLKCSTSNCLSKPKGNKNNDRISRTTSRNMKNKLNANSKPICANCKKSMVDGIHDKCLLDFVENVNSRAKSAKKHKKQNISKPTVHVFTEVGLKWKPKGRTFTIVGNSCPLTRFTLANVVPPKKTTSHSVETQKPELKVYSRKPKIVKNVGSSKKDKIVESKTANHSKPNHTWGSYAIDILSSSSLVMTDLCEFYENVGISHQTSVARTPQQNDVVERQNRTLIEAARTMLIFSKAPLFLWAEVINTACYTQNHSIIHRRYNKTPYELMQDKKPDLSFFHVFDALCYPTNDNDDLGKLDAKADIGIFVYAAAKKAFRIYIKRTQKIIEIIHVAFDELTTIASEQFSSEVGLQYMTPATSSSGLFPNPVSQQPCTLPLRDDWDHLFQLMFDEYFTPPSIAVSPVQEAAASRAMVLADSPMLTFIGQDAPSSSTPSTQEQEQSPNISQDFEESQKHQSFMMTHLMNLLMKNPLLKGHHRI
ncbi:retrovirus-related pol polyprotein from transposon TNT 1-94 [Tanacetum coccineum]